MPTTAAQRHIQSIQRMDAILEAIAASQGGTARLTEIATATRLHKNTAFSLLRTMVALGYCNHCATTQGYRIGRRAFELARLAERDLDIIGIVRPLMLHLVHQFRESLSLAAPGTTAGTVVATVEGTYGVRGTRFQGQRAPYNASALRKALLVAMPPEERADLLGRMTFERFTSRTIMTAHQLLADCETAAARGYALSIAEEEIGERRGRRAAVARGRSGWVARDLGALGAAAAVAARRTGPASRPSDRGASHLKWAVARRCRTLLGTAVEAVRHARPDADLTRRRRRP